MMKQRRILFGIGVAAVLVLLFTWNFMRGAGGLSQAGTTTQRNAPSDSNATTTSQATVQQTTRDLSGDNDSIVVYFSRTEGVWDGPLEVGHTKQIADFIQQVTNADTYEIIPVVDYPTEYEATANQAREEQRANARPAIREALPDLSGYENIFIGAPVWWSEYPMIVRTFLDAEKEALENKRLIPFTTHLGSGLGNTQRQLIQQFPNATVLDGFTIRGEDDTVAAAQPQVSSWLQRIGVTQ